MLQEAIEDIKSKAFEQLSDETKDALRTAADFRRQLEESSHGVENVLQAPRRPFHVVCRMNILLRVPRARASSASAAIPASVDGPRARLGCVRLRLLRPWVDALAVQAACCGVQRP